MIVTYEICGGSAFVSPCVGRSKKPHTL